ncbi:MAG: methyltransferase type 11 [Parcubacteria group bacterium Athens0714_26]|nr:MAG: methyltransferase type 11 [Parcubacteria group bacterium Athens1014_26]TSD02625.1 MAG: methyltransferase type 11 [Parcubacteria group bacterium Athens0714_26]
MKNGIEEVYQYHHRSRPSGFAVLSDERGKFFNDWIGAGKSVLDLGCRDGTLARYFLKDNKVFGADIDAKALQKAAENGIITSQIDLNGSWEYLDGGKFDAVVAAEVLEHLYFPEVVLEKIFGVLKQGGILVGSVPNAFSLKNRIRLFWGRKKNTSLGDPTHINHFSFGELNQLLKKRFIKVQIKPLVRYPFGLFAKFVPGLVAYNFVFLAKKS